MAAKYIIASVCLVLLYSYTVRSLECFECDDLDGEKCADAVLSQCARADDDICLKITTVYQMPNNGPEDRLSDNEEATYVYRSCANLKEFTPYFSKKVNWCDIETIGGGGTQQRCICAGNKCNSVSRVQASGILALLTTSALVVLFK